MSVFRVAELEARFAAELAVPHAIAFSNARTALLAIFGAAGIARGDEVILSPLTCRVVPLALLAAVRPRYADTASDTLNLDVTALEAAIGPMSRAVLFQHTYGTTTGAKEVGAAARRRGILVIEDCAQVMPTRSAMPDGSTGIVGDAAIFSLGLLKPLPAGAGGLAVTGDATLAAGVRRYRERLEARSGLADAKLAVEAFVQRRFLNPGTYWTALAVHRALLSCGPGSNLEDEIERLVLRDATRASEYQARRGLIASRAIGRYAARRAECCAWYDEAFRDVPGVSTVVRASGAPLYYYPVLTDRKAALLARAERAGVQIVAWPNKTTIYDVDDPSRLSRYGYRLGSCPNAEATAARLVGLPTGPDVAASHLRKAADLVRASTT